MLFMFLIGKVSLDRGQGSQHGHVHMKVCNLIRICEHVREENKFL